MQSIETEGDSIDAAIDKALKQLGTTRDRVEVEILSNATRGLLGIGSRKARVRASLRKSIDLESEAVAETAAVPQAAAGAVHVEKPTSVNHAAARPPSSRPKAASRPVTTELSETDRATAERARSVLLDIVKHVGVEADVKVGAEDGQILLELTGDTSGVLIGRRGQMLDALEYVLNRIVLKDQSDAARIFIDSQNYRARRRESLEQMARRMADEAKKRGRAVTLNPLSPRDRRIVHLVLQDDPTLSTKSSGEGYFRKLVILPKDARRGPRSERHRGNADG